MPKLSVSREIVIDAKPEVVFTVLTDFHQWRIWSPWLVTEPEAQMTVAQNGKSYQWLGERVGEGKMTMVNSQSPTLVEYDLAFIKPWESHAKVFFHLAENNGKTTVRWTMDSSLPFFMFWLTKTMKALIGMDYHRGLVMLKDYVETGTVHSQMQIKAQSQFDGFKYIAVKNTCSTSDIGAVMAKDFEKLQLVIDKSPELTAGPAFSIYHKFDMVKDQVAYTCGVAINESATVDLPLEIVTGEIPTLKTYQLKHVGSYKFLGNVWSTAVSLQRAKVFKPSKKHHPFELYLNSPLDTSEEQLETLVCFAVK